MISAAVMSSVALAGPFEDLIRQVDGDFIPSGSSLNSGALPAPPPSVKIERISLKENWDDAISWDNTPTSQHAYPNPSSNPWAELLIGDSSTWYKMPNIRTYFRFRLNLPAGAHILGAKLVFHCSAGGPTKPKLDIHYIDTPNPSFRKEPWNLPLSRLSVPWEKEEHDWTWITHEVYKTPDLKALIEEFAKKFGRNGVIGLEIIDRPGNVDNFKGLTSFDDEPALSTQLEIQYQ